MTHATRSAAMNLKAAKHPSECGPKGAHLSNSVMGRACAMAAARVACADTNQGDEIVKTKIANDTAIRALIAAKADRLADARELAPLMIEACDSHLLTTGLPEEWYIIAGDDEDDCYIALAEGVCEIYLDDSAIPEAARDAVLDAPELAD